MKDEKHSYAMRYKKGRNLEYKVMAILAKQGYIVSRFTQSRGTWDVFAINNKELRLIQVKSERPPTKKEMTQMKQYPNPLGVQKELWIYKGREKKFDIQIL